MSARQIRKLYGDNSLPPPDDDSEEEYEPLYAKGSSSQVNSYKGLVLSSNSESERESDEGVLDTLDEPVDHTSKKKHKKKKKHQKKLKDPQTSSTSEKLEDLDEVDRSVKEVNALLGMPPPAPSVSNAQPIRDPLAEIMSINYKHVNVANELERLFGPEESTRKKRGRQTNMNKLLRRAVIIPPNDPPNYPKSGLSMSIVRREKDCTYFAFDHSRDYQRIHRAYLQSVNYSRPQNLPQIIEDAQRHMHIETLLESADSMFRYESYSSANTVIEQCIAYMQYVAHPTFNLTNRNIRLEYIYMENRAFHVAVLKYLHLLTNRACHRTALELAKLLLNLDPSDPLAVVFIIDTLALRAREHQWLIRAVEQWDKERNAGVLFNMKYSIALANFHVASKNKKELTMADELLKDALMRYPYVYLRIMHHASTPIATNVKDCPLFVSAENKCSKSFLSLMSLYAKFTCAKWREPAVFEWLARNASELVERYQSDQALQELAEEYAKERQILYKGWPNEILRHMTIIRPMNNLLVDGEVPSVKRARAADPVPPEGGKSRFGYYNLPNERGGGRGPSSGSPFYELLASIAPRYELPMMHEMLERGFNPEAMLAPMEDDDDIHFELVAPGDDGIEVLPPLEPDDAQDEANGPRNHDHSFGALANTLRQFLRVFEGPNIVYELAEGSDDEDDDDVEPFVGGLDDPSDPDPDPNSDNDDIDEYNLMIYRGDNM